MKQPNFYTSVLLAWLSATHTAYSELPKGKTWETSSFKEILQHYEFVADLRVRPAERHISKELFWRYPIPLPTAEFEIDHSLGDEAGEMPATEGATLPIRHMNLGRILYREGKYDQARRIWLTARARFGNIFEYHRRNDYLAAVAFLKLAQEKGKQFNYAYGDRNVRIPYSNVATFLSWAFIKKAHIPDPLLEQVAPKGLYLLAVLYLTFQRFNAAQATAASGLDFLKANGRNEYRTGFNEIIAENWIRNRDYYTAIRTLDENIRSTSEPKVAARAFHRIADIYFDLNQYDLADEVYRMAQAVDRHAYQIHPLSYFLRGESLFWRGLFKEAREALKYSLYANELPHAKPKLKTIFIAWAKLRLADTYLALYREHKDKGTKSSKELGKILSKAKLEYYKVSHHFPLTEPGEIAQVRRDCLELPV
ncbi:MAG: hypothetical protein OXT67_14105, partial [Zetaproteobacteria bacterium]|nr:hypothetical protein [Zetaproteobacteria bacterium]